MAAVEHPTECATIDRAGTDAEANDPARVLIHDDQDPVGPQRRRLAPEQIHTPQVVFHVAQESQLRGATGGLSRPVVMGENPSNHVFVDLDVERQGDLLGKSRTSPVGIPQLHSDDPREGVLRSVLSGVASVGDLVRIASGTFAGPWLCEGLAVSKASVRLRNGADELRAPRASSSRQGCGPTQIDSAIVARSDAQSGVGA